MIYDANFFVVEGGYFHLSYTPMRGLGVSPLGLIVKRNDEEERKAVEVRHRICKRCNLKIATRPKRWDDCRCWTWGGLELQGTSAEG